MEAQETDADNTKEGSSFIVLGCGNSTGVPWLNCLLDTKKTCSTCQNCLNDPQSKNIRNNPSAIIRYAHPDGRMRNILIDCGKTFRDSVLKHFAKNDIKTVDAILLTHSHADAYLGLDDMRDVAPYNSVPVYLTEDSFEVAKRVFPYLTNPKVPDGIFVARLEWNIIKPWESFNVQGVDIMPIPVDHGKGYTCIGYEFGAADSRVVYISDVSEVPERTMEYIVSKPTDLLILDALSYHGYPTHFTFPQSIECANKIAARSTRFVGMNHTIDYYTENKKLKEEGKKDGRKKIRLAYDGWRTTIRI